MIPHHAIRKFAKFLLKEYKDNKQKNLAENKLCEIFYYLYKLVFAENNGHVGMKL